MQEMGKKYVYVSFIIVEYPIYYIITLFSLKKINTPQNICQYHIFFLPLPSHFTINSPSADDVGPRNVVDYCCLGC